MKSVWSRSGDHIDRLNHGGHPSDSSDRSERTAGGHGEGESESEGDGGVPQGSGAVHDATRTGADEPMVGIDFGTSNSSIAIWNPEEKRVKVIRNSVGNTLVRSTVQFNSNNFTTAKVGLDEIDLKVPIIGGIKGMLGVDSQQTVHCRNASGVEADMSPIDICAIILRELVHNAELYLSKRRLSILPKDSSLQQPSLTYKISSAVIGVPAHFGEARKAALRKAANEAGINHV
jgi:molecular chaperone DnaK (HSP70)